MNKNKQVVRLLGYFLFVEPKISQLIAGKVLGIERLAARVWDLRKQGYPITKVTKKDIMGRRYAEYQFNL